MKTLVIVSATRHSEEAFKVKSWLGQCLQLFPKDKVIFEIFYENYKGLSKVYNEVTAKYKERDDIEGYLFIHDDVRIEDAFIFSKLEYGFTMADILGLAGSNKFSLAQPTWFGTDREGWSGTVWHPINDKGQMVSTTFGPCPQQCIVMDGLFLAVKFTVFNKVSFDELFTFHHYDIDFCLTANSKGHTLCTLPIHVIHGSAGNYGSASWNQSAKTFVDKWTLLGSSIKAREVLPTDTPETLSRFNSSVSRYEFLASYLVSYEKPYTLFIDPRCKEQPGLATVLLSAMNENVDMLALLPRCHADNFLKTHTDSNDEVFVYLEEKGLSYYSLVVGYEVWAPYAGLVKTSLVKEFFESSFYEDFIDAYPNITRVNMTRLFSAYIMYKQYSLFPVKFQILTLTGEEDRVTPLMVIP